MTREQAITKLALHLMQCGMLMPIEWIDKNGEGSDTMLAFNMAIEALREQAERSKGCEYCLQGEDLAYGLDSMQRTGRIYIDGNLLTADLYSESMAVAVCYCPVCGKRLEVERGKRLEVEP